MIEVKDVIVLRFLDQHLEASKILGEWYLDSLIKGMTHEVLENYIFDQWLLTAGYNTEQINFLKDEYIKYESNYAQSLMALDKDDISKPVEAPAEETFTEMLEKNPVFAANPRTLEFASQIDLTSFLTNELPAEAQPLIPGLIEWFKSVELITGLEYLFGTYLPQYIGQLASEKLSLLFDEYCMEMMLNDKKEVEQEQEKSIEEVPVANSMEILLKENVNLTPEQFKQIMDWYNTVDKEVGDKYIFGELLPSFMDAEAIQTLVNKYNNIPLENSMPLEVLDIKVNEVENKVEVLVQNAAKEQIVATLLPSNNQVVNTVTEKVYEDDAISTLTDAETNLATMRQLEEEIKEKMDKVLLLKKPYMFGNNYVNDNYKHCPSFYKLLPQIQNAIIKRREQKSNEKWFEKYRPELVEEILFPNQVIKETINEYVDNKRIAGNCMFYGFGGVGKTTTNIVLMNSVLENVADRFFLDRKVESVDELKGWLNKKPIGKQKIVIAEEFDRLSDAAMTELKNGLMEKYEYVVFLASTNKIHKIDEALLTRFTLISKFETAQVQDITAKCKYILTNERVNFTEENLAFFVEQNKLKGIRTILNNLQLSCYMGVFEPKRTAFFVGDSGTEYDMISWIKWYINYLIQLNKDQLWYLSYDLNQDQNVAKIRATILETLLANYSLNYEYIFLELLKDNLFLPIKNCVNMYYQDIDSKRVKSMHFEAMLNDFITILFTTKDVYLK